jgi:hypothetical protein
VLIRIKVLVTGALLAGLGWLVAAPTAEADPLIPPTPAELQFLAQARRILPGAGDPVAFNSDGELLDQGRLVCTKRDVAGEVGTDVTYVSPIITQLAFTYLCPQ